MIPIEKFGHPGIEGEAVIKSVVYDWNSELDVNRTQTDTYLACGYCKRDGESVGLVVHGTGDEEDPVKVFKRPRLMLAPSDENKRPVATEFHGVEAVPETMVRLVGCYVLGGEMRKRRGFFYEGPLDGSGTWYPVDAPGCDESIAVASKDHLIAAYDPSFATDEIHVMSLKDLTWSVHHTGFAVAPKRVEITAQGDRYKVEGELENGSLFAIRLEA